ncbi:hypothetical protein [Streptomyces sp. TE4109]
MDATTQDVTKRYTTPFGASRGAKSTTWLDDNRGSTTARVTASLGATVGLLGRQAPLPAGPMARRVAVAVVAGKGEEIPAMATEFRLSWKVSATESEKHSAVLSATFLAMLNTSDGYSTVIAEPMVGRVLQGATTVISATSGWLIRDAMLALTSIRSRLRLLRSSVNSRASHTEARAGRMSGGSPTVHIDGDRFANLAPVSLVIQ